MTSVLNSTTIGSITLSEELYQGSSSSENFTTNTTGWGDLIELSTWPYPVTLSSKAASLGISEYNIRRFSQITKLFVNPLLSLVGFIGNGLGVGVLWRQGQQQKLSIYWYLGALTIMDIVFLGSGIINSTHSLVKPFDQELSKYLLAHMRLGLTYIDNLLLHSARMLVLIMSFERLLSVAIPFRVKDTWLAQFPLRMILAVLFFNMAFSLPLLIYGKVVTFRQNNITEYVFTFRNYDNFMTQYWVIEAVVHSFIPMILLVAINVAIPVQFYTVSVKRRSSLNASSNNTSSQHRKITATVMTITIMNILLSIPIVVVKLLQYINPDFNMTGKHRLVFWFLADLSKCLAYINAATDFVVFFLVSKNYRAVFMAMYCKSRIGSHKKK